VLPFDAARAVLEEYRLREGHLVFNPQAEMTRGRRESVNAIINSSEVTKELTDRIIGKGVPQVDAIRVSKFMEMRLTGNPDEFAIEELTPRRQPILNSGDTEWRWAVTPRAPGNRLELELNVFLVLNVEGGEAPKLERSQLRTISVRSSSEPPDVTLFMESFVKGIVADPKWVLTSLLGVVGTIWGAVRAWIYAKRKRRRRRQPKD